MYIHTNSEPQQMHTAINKMFIGTVPGTHSSCTLSSCHEALIPTQRACSNVIGNRRSLTSHMNKYKLIKPLEIKA